MAKLVRPVSLPGSSLLVRANEGRTLNAFGKTVIILLDGKQTGEKFVVISVRRAPGQGRTITNAKMNGSISSKAGLVFT
jgi:hypothetical protein